MRISLAVLLASSSIVGCGPTANAPDAPVVDDDAPAPCDAAAFARTLVGMELRQLTAAEPLADPGDCHHYRGSIELLEVDETACTLSGRFGYSGMASGGVVAGSDPFTCSIRDSLATGVYCVADDIGMLGGRDLGMTFSASTTGDPSLTMTLSDVDGGGSISCIDGTEPVP